MRHALGIVLPLLVVLSSPTRADRGRGEGATCKKDLDCASRRCGLTHGDWICMAPKASPSRPTPPPPSSSSPAGPPARSSPTPARPAPAELAAQCRRDAAAYQRATKPTLELISEVLVRCSASCDDGNPASCRSLEASVKLLCSTGTCDERVCLSGLSPSLQRAFNCTKPPATKPARRAPASRQRDPFGR